MLPRDMGLPDVPTTLHPSELQDPLTTSVSGRAGSWHPGYAFYNLGIQDPGYPQKVSWSF